MKSIVLFMGQYSAKGQKFHEALRRAGFECFVVALEDDGFLPEGVISPYEYYILKQNQEIHLERKLHYNFLEIPEFWEIRPGAIFDMGKKMASVVCREPKEEGTVQQVEWEMEDGWVYRIDYYNKYGLKFASEFMDKNRRTESKVYYSDSLQEVIVEQPQNDTVTLLEKGKVRVFFTSYRAFLDSFLSEVDCDGNHVLFWDDEKNDLFSYLVSSGNIFWKGVVFQNKNLLENYAVTVGKGMLFYEIPVTYPINQAKGEILILTASDQIARIDVLIERLPRINFHIAANTLVSDKLYSLQRRWTNVKVYPGVGQNELENLWQSCDFYLDINYYWEIYDAVDQASQRNLLILGFEDTLHRKELVVEECVFPGESYEEMIRMLENLSQNSEAMLQILKKQQMKRYSVWERLNKMLEWGEVTEDGNLCI